MYPLLAMMEQCLKEISQLTPNLYLASVAAISDEALNKNNINLIINASKELSMFPPKDNRINTIRVPVYDNCEETLYPYFKVIFLAIVNNFINFILKRTDGGATVDFIITLLIGKSFF